MKPLPGSGGSGMGYAPPSAAPAPAVEAPAAPAPAAADPYAAALASYSQAAAPAAPAPVAPVTPAFTEGSSVASGSVWASLAGSQQMKPLPGSGGSGFKASSSTFAAPSFATATPETSTYSAPAPASTGGSSVASGSVWESLAGSQSMKPLPGSSGPGFQASSSTPAYSAPAPVAPAPVAAAPASSVGSSVASGSVWASLAESKSMKPLPGSSGPGFQASSGTPAYSAPAPVAPAPVAAAPVSSVGSSVASGSVWENLAGSQRMKPLPGSSGPGFQAGSSSYTPPAVASAPVAAAPVPVAAAPVSSVESSVASGSVWASLAESKRMKPLPGSTGPGFKVKNLSEAVSASATYAEAETILSTEMDEMMNEIRLLQQDMQLQADEVDALRDRIVRLEDLVGDLQKNLEAVLDERDSLRAQLAAVKTELSRLSNGSRW